MFEGLLAVSRGDVVCGLRLLRAGFDGLGESLPAFDHVKFQIDIAETLGRTGQIADGLTMAEQAIERCEQTNERWLFAELLRIKGELMLRKESATASPACCAISAVALKRLPSSNQFTTGSQRGSSRLTLLARKL
jgi:predicted ATPase